MAKLSRRWNCWTLFLGSAVIAACGSGKPSDTGALGTTGNLIVNGDAESAAGSTSGDVLAEKIPAWTTMGNANVLIYGARGGYPKPTDPGPSDRGSNFLSGGPNDAESVFTQHIDLGRYARFISGGKVSFSLAAYLGGYAEQDDHAVLTLTFLDGGGQPVGAVTLGPVLADARDEDTGLLPRATTGAVPAQAVAVDVQLTMTRTEGSANDGYADSLVLTLTDMPSAADAGGGPETGPGADAALDGGADDAAPVDGGTDGSGTVSPATAHLLAELERARQGLAADLDGDGKAEWTSTFSGGDLVRFQVDRDGDGVPEGVYTYDPAAGSGSLEVDADENTVVEYRLTFTSNPDQSIEWTDADLDGVIDSKRTQLWEPEKSRMTVTLEADPDQNGTYDPISTAQEPLQRAKCGKPTGATPTGGGCNAFAAFPSGGDKVGPAPVSILTDGNKPAGSMGNCSATDAMKLQKALDCAMGKGDKCMADTNLAASLRLRAGFLRGSLTIGCGSACDPATTTVDCPVWKFGKCDSKMSINVAQLANMSDGEACSMMIHELLHWVGVADAGSGDGGHDDGVDRVYACGRYCAGCVNTSGNTPAGCGVTRNSDCATCAGTKAEKKQCGTKQEVAATKNNYSVCHAGLGCLLKQCEAPIGVNLLACDGTKLEDGPFLCCQSCPADCNQTNDDPCTNLPPPVDSCGYAPPGC